MITRERMFVIVGSVVAVLLQLLVAPHIAVLGIVPNFIVAFTLAIAIVRPGSFGGVMPFVLGLAYDFMGGGPVGAMAFSLTLFSVLIAAYFMRVDNDSLLMGIALLALGIVFVEASYGVFMLLFGYNAGLFGALAYRVAPCFLYDFVLALIIYPIALRFAKASAVVRADITQLR